MEAEGLTVEGSAEDTSAVLEKGAGVASDDDAALDDEYSLIAVETAALEDGRLNAPEEDATFDSVSVGIEDAAVLEGGRIELASEDDGSGVLPELEDTAGDELAVVPDGALADEGAILGV
ncbi:hypothetical protein E8E12_010700 [Didymella heteroderae]|uniref:Uncharacterized protein n=1 Tax=Didymella heteroderae TaxID=1769908 RepID=A0A9P4X2E1_9PLEO|nr:hypothetical protein E8E12_010700 [Didymella heteroderae]